MSSWSVLVTIHNLVNVPVSACDGARRTFSVEAHMLNRASAYTAPVAAAIFTTDDVVSSTPNLLEVRLDELPFDTQGGRGGPKVWRCALPQVEITVMVKELSGGLGASRSRPSSRNLDDSFSADGTRLIGSSSPILLNVKKIVEVDKLTTRVVGTEMGQVGLSFTVDPGDKTGYQHRLESFLRTHNPQGLRLVPNVVEVVSELDTFTKLYRRYKIQDYAARLNNFFSVYGAQYKSEIPSLLRQWEGREEELMRNLVLDNGPELNTIDLHQRLTAFLTGHQLSRGTAAVEEIFSAHAADDTDEGLFTALVEHYGPESDPRTYLFATPRYTAAAKSQGSNAGAITIITSSPNAEASQLNTSSEGPRRHPPSPPLAGQLLSVSLSPNANPPPESEAVDVVRSLGKSPTFDARTGQPEKNSATLRHENRPAARPRMASSSHQIIPTGSGARMDERGDLTVSGEPSALWRRMCDAMSAAQPMSIPWRESQLFFLSADEFRAAVRALHLFKGEAEVQSLAAEWRRRIDRALKEDPLAPSDAYYGAAVQEVTALTGLTSLRLQVVSATSLFHKEQYAGFSSYVEEQAKAAKTERLVFVGDARRMQAMARYGCHSAADVDETSLSPSAMVPGDGTNGNGPILFRREPFRHQQNKIGCAVLVCEVAVGGTYVCPPEVHAPREATAEFLSHYDSCAYEDAVLGPVLAVYARQQVMPRLLLQCIVDPQLLPCPTHPDRPVEYYVMDSHAFACSRCVVLGAYKGREVTPIEEAAVLARAGLAEMERTTAALRESMLAYASYLRNAEAGLPTAPRRIEAEREVTRLQEEVAERVRAIRRQVQLEDDADTTRIHAHRAEVEATLRAVDELTTRIDAALHLPSVAGTVNALLHLQQEDEVEQLLLRVRERVPTAPLERVLPLDGRPELPQNRQNAAVHRTPAAAVVGLNESGVSRAGSRGGGNGNAFLRNRPAASGSSATQVAKPPPSGDGAGNSLYAQYLSLTGGEGSPSSRARGIPQSSYMESKEASVSSAKEALTQGWSLLRRGDVDGAQRAWLSICSTHGTADVLGTKAHAYLAEAIDKDYTAAAQWYARSLQLDPQDRMTAYNYAVLLEALLDDPDEALRLYDRAAALGDTIAAARARELRAAASVPAGSG